MKKLKIHASWREYLDVLVGDPEPFTTTTGNLWGTKGSRGVGRLPRNLAEAIIDMEPDYTVYSYATPIAWRRDGQWFMPDVYYSVTTTRHQNKISTAIGEMR